MAEDVAKVFENDIDGVVVALGGKTSDVGDTMLTDGTNNVMAAMKAKGVKRISVVTSIGAGDSKDQAPFAFKLLMMTVMKKIFTDKNNQEAAVAASGLEYCLVRPGGLTVDPPTGGRRAVLPGRRAGPGLPVRGEGAVHQLRGGDGESCVAFDRISGLSVRRRER